MAAAFVLVRFRRTVNMIPAVVLGSALPAFLVLAAGLAAPSSVPLDSVGLLILMGLILLPISFALITIGPRYIPAPEVGLLLLLETVLGPFWVWLAIREQVGAMTLIGGGVVIATLIVNSALALRGPASSGRAQAASPAPARPPIR
jgi:drug/metabolite transporter (DMT)-like permease